MFLWPIPIFIYSVDNVYSIRRAKRDRNLVTVHVDMIRVFAPVAYTHPTAKPSVNHSQLHCPDNKERDLNRSLPSKMSSSHRNMDAISIIELIFHRFEWIRWVTLTISYKFHILAFYVETCRQNIPSKHVVRYHFSLSSRKFFMRNQNIARKLASASIRRNEYHELRCSFAVKIILKRQKFSFLRLDSIFLYSITKCSTSSWQLVINRKMYNWKLHWLELRSQQIPRYGMQAGEWEREKERESFFVPEKSVSIPGIRYVYGKCALFEAIRKQMLQRIKGRPP